MPRITIKTNPAENNIHGLYSSGDIVLVKCDCTDGDYEILMPDSYSSEDTKFEFSKPEASLNVVKIRAMENQTIMTEEYQELTECGDLLELRSDGEGNWW